MPELFSRPAPSLAAIIAGSPALVLRKSLAIRSPYSIKIYLLSLSSSIEVLMVSASMFWTLEN